MWKKIGSLTLLLASFAAMAQAPGSEEKSSAKDENLKVRVDWGKVVRPVDPLAYAVNCPDCLDPAWSKKPELLKALATVTDGGKPLIRLSGWGMVTQGFGETWLNADGTWNGPKIKDALTPLVQAKYKLMINILSGPGGEQDHLEPGAMATLAASLVKIVNVDYHLGVKYWEIPNEREHVLTASQMAAMFSRASAAMKAVDSTILVGGPAMESIDSDYIGEVVKQSLPQIDFVTVHTYGGDGKQSDAASYSSAIEAVRQVHALRDRLTSITQGKHLPIFVDEYNIGWDSTPKIADNAGAVYFSIIQSGVIEAGGNVSAVWDFSPSHNMSIVDKDGNLYPSANIFTLMNRYFYGDEVAATSSDPAAIRAYAVQSVSAHSVMSSNLGDSPLSVSLEFSSWKPKGINEYQISAAGYKELGRRKWSEVQWQGIKLPAKSVTILVAQ